MPQISLQQIAKRSQQQRSQVSTLQCLRGVRLCDFYVGNHLLVAPQCSSKRAFDAHMRTRPARGGGGRMNAVCLHLSTAIVIKAQLLDSLYGTERGLSASSELRGEISELISQLEAANPNSEDPNDVRRHCNLCLTAPSL